jgi:signal recognition particle subunit SRP72
VLQAEIVALLKLDKPKEALDLLDRQGLNLPFHRAYAYYKLSAYEDSLEICVKFDSHEFLLLRAQNYYRIGYSEKATEIYEQLMAKDSGNTELAINLSAALISPVLCSRAMNHMFLNDAKSWEILFNQSCAVIMSGKYPEALELLQRVQEVLMADDQYEDEKFLVTFQRAYIYSLMQDTETSTKLYNEIIQAQSADENLKQVAICNIAVLSEKESADTLKKFLKTLDISDKLTVHQKVAIYHNLALIYYRKKKYADAEECLRQTDKYPVAREKSLTIRAFILYKEKKESEYRNLLLNCEPALKAYGIQLLSKIYSFSNRPLDAAEALYALKNIPECNNPEIYIKASDVFSQVNDLDKAIEVLNSGYSSFPKDKKITLALADVYAKKNAFDDAISLLKNYLSKGEDLDVRGALVIIAANCKNQGEILSYASKLPAVNLKALYRSEDVVESLDDILDRLEFANLQWKSRVEEKKLAEIKRKKRNRKPKYPKGFDPNNPNNPKPDPERWLPKQLRSTAKKQYRKKRKMQGPQGAVPTQAGQEVGTFYTGPKTAHTEIPAAKSRKRRRN